MEERPIRIKACLREGEEEKFTLVEVESDEDLEKVAKALGTVILESKDYDAVIDARDRLLFMKRVKR